MGLMVDHPGRILIGRAQSLLQGMAISIGLNGVVVDVSVVPCVYRPIDTLLDLRYPLNTLLERRVSRCESCILLP
jgi:hypothetical protein